jgi:hypothetical protein
VTLTEIVESVHSEPKYASISITVRDTRSKYLNDTTPMDGPGQLLTHYSPSVPTFLITPSSFPAAGMQGILVRPGAEPIPMNEVVVLDFKEAVGARLVASGVSPLAARSISSGDVLEACHEVFDALRWTESVQGARAVVVPLLSEWIASDNDVVHDELLAAVEDRLFRAASGVVVSIR